MRKNNLCLAYRQVVETYFLDLDGKFYRINRFVEEDEKKVYYDVARLYGKWGYVIPFVNKNTFHRVVNYLEHCNTDKLVCIGNRATKRFNNHG